MPDSPVPQPVPDWERRFRAPRIGLPEWARDAPDRCVVVASSAGSLEVHSWDRRSGALVQATARKEGTSSAAIDPSGAWIWWFDDADGDEFGIWRRQPFGSGPTSGERPLDGAGEGDADGDDPVEGDGKGDAAAAEDATGLAPGWTAGLLLGRGGLAVVGRADDDGTEIWVVPTAASGAPGVAPSARLLYRHREDAQVTALSEDDALIAIAHSEHGDSRHPALRVLRVADGQPAAELYDGPGLGVDGLDFAPVAGDPRLLVQHERNGRSELLILDVLTGAEYPLVLGLDGEVAGADWLLDASGLLVLIDHHARSRLYRVELDDAGTAVASVTPVGPTSGTVLRVTPRPDGDAWLSWSSSANPPGVRDLDGSVLLVPPGDPAPPSVPVEDLWVSGPGGPIHALLRRPAGVETPLPLIVDVHGGPTAHDEDAFRAYTTAWVDNGYAVVQVNYRGSTGYGSAWRDALEARVGHVELEDVVAVRDHLVSSGVADGTRVVLYGASWGGYLTLLGLGTYPDRWALGIAGVPVADYVAAYEDEMEGLKAFDRSLFGGSPSEVPERYRESSPLTYVDDVRAPVLVLAGENDPRCPIRQIDNYVAALGARGGVVEVYRFDAGHGSLVDDERVRQARVELDFAARHLR